MRKDTERVQRNSMSSKKLDISTLMTFIVGHIAVEDEVSVTVPQMNSKGRVLSESAAV